MSAFPSSSIGLPRSLNYEMPPSASDSCRSYSVNLSPDGITQVLAPAPPANLFVANNIVPLPFNSQVISFSIPSGNSNSVFLDPTNTTLSFTLTYNISTASATTAGVVKLISSASSFFDQLVLYSNNTPIEQINQYGLLQNFLLQNTVSLSQRAGGISIAMGADSNGASGIELGTTLAAPATYRYNFSIPLLSMIGINSDKLFPVGMVNNLQLQMTTATILPIISFCTAVATQPIFSQSFLLSEFSLNLKYVDIGESASQMLMASIPDNRILYKTSTYTNSQVSLPNGSAGAQQLLLQIRNTSVKSVYHQFGQSNSIQAQALVSPNGYYDACNIGCNSRQCQVGGMFFPNRPLNDVSRPSESYTYLINALGGSIPSALGTVVSREMFSSIGGTTLPTGSNIDTVITLPAATSRPQPNGSDGGAVSVIHFPSGHFLGYDLERLGGVMFSGVNTRSTPPFLNLNILNALNATITCNAWGYSDAVLVFDIGSKSVQAFV
jgi:hypothetical protein